MKLKHSAHITILFCLVFTLQQFSNFSYYLIPASDKKEQHEIVVLSGSKKSSSAAEQQQDDNTIMFLRNISSSTISNMSSIDIHPSALMHQFHMIHLSLFSFFAEIVYHHFKTL